MKSTISDAAMSWASQYQNRVLGQVYWCSHSPVNIFADMLKSPASIGQAV